ncbi:TonB-dependent siderophore receptor [Stenotrophomonas sp. ZAC14D2_NAIMI4_6]|uniref:TonB-dependent siderophore receptor n=1 Tax=Stenotrophomonas sp. ZAC14D2_NAIMI4_6 TaxID=2072406 RepID=UPI000D541790|nr:TonB-dependent siderophore receptor [Stenotrophomonas sp. ZAC14D2_NAIMI4_6]AWH21581.1 TonB-dependent siderophore receptor [Stenotrophomonas sp. ZAC14D2_NAIMI4_6]
MNSSAFPVRSPLSTALALALALSAPLAAHAQTQTPDGSSPTDLDAVHVNAYRTLTHTSGATKTDTPVAEMAKSVSVIAREELDARGVQTLNEAMRYVAGVSLESSGIDNRVDDFRIRGFDAGSWSNNVTIDGMRAPQGGQWNRTMVDSWNLDRVEVLKGPSAVMYGQVAPGGMVNQVSKTPTPDQQQIVQLGVDGNGQYSTAFDVGAASADKQHLGRLVGLYRDGDTQIKHTEQEHWFLAPSYTFQMAERTRLTLLGLYQRDDGGSTYQFLPMAGTLNATPYGHMKNSTFIGEPNWNTYDRTIWSAGWMFEHAFNENWTLSQSARRLNVDSTFRTVVTNGALNADGRTQKRRATWGEGDSRGDTADTRLTGKFSTGAAQHMLLVGVDWQKADWDAARGAMGTATDTPNAIDIFNPVYTGYIPATTSISYSGGINRQTGVYLQDQIALDKWRFTVGGRYDWTKDDTWTQAYTVASNRFGARTPSRIKNEAFSGNAGILFVADNGLTPYLSYAESFQPAGSTATQSFDRTPFDPITGKQWEAGVKYQPANFDGLVTLSAYDLRQQNVLTDDPDSSHNTCGTTGTSQCQVQDGEGRVRGVELEGRVTPLAGFSVIGAAAWMDSEVTRSNNGYRGKQLAMVPDWTAALWGDYTFQGGALEGLSLAAGVRYNGKSYGDSANLYQIPSYTLWDAALRYDIGQYGNVGTQLSLNVSNLADKRFVSTCTGVSSCYYGTGRTVTATARFTW